MTGPGHSRTCPRGVRRIFAMKSLPLQSIGLNKGWGNVWCCVCPTKKCETTLCASWCKVQRGSTQTQCPVCKRS